MSASPAFLQEVRAFLRPAPDEELRTSYDYHAGVLGQEETSHQPATALRAAQEVGLWHAHVYASDAADGLSELASFHQQTEAAFQGHKYTLVGHVAPTRRGVHVFGQFEVLLRRWDMAVH